LPDAPTLRCCRRRRQRKQRFAALLGDGESAAELLGELQDDIPVQVDPADETI